MSVARASNLVVGPSTHLRRLPIAESLTLLRTGPASIPLAPGVKSLRFRYVADTTGDPGCREFVRRFAPQLAYANPNLPFHLERIPDPRRRPRLPDAAPILPWPGGERPAPQMTIEFENRPAETREYLSVPAKTILVELCQLTGTKASVLDEVEVVPLIAGPDREGGGRAAEAVDEGDEDAAGVGPEASAEMESMAGASAVAKEDPEQEEGDGRRQLAE